MYTFFVDSGCRGSKLSIKREIFGQNCVNHFQKVFNIKIMPKRLEKNLWDIALGKSKENENSQTQQMEDMSLCVTGSKNSGKTSVILRFLDREETPKPTVALEYTFGRRAKGHNIAKDVGHIWELGGGAWLSKLLDVPINPETIMNCALCIMVDLSKPTELWFTIESVLQAARARIETIIAELKSSQPDIRDILKNRAWDRVGPEHDDKGMMDPFLVPLIIIGGKYDLFQEFDSEQRKVISKSLRFLAHTYGATLQYFSIKNEHLVTRSKALFGAHLFGTTMSKTIQVDYNKPLVIPAGLDSFHNIGSPPISDKDLGRVSAKTPIDLWKQAFVGYFPQENTNNPSMVEDPSKDPQYAEVQIDNLRRQKDEELERYRKHSERWTKEMQAQY